MSAEGIANIVVDAISQKQVDFVGLNLANADMVAHTGDVNATIDACTYVDEQLKRIAEVIDAQHGILAVVGDHGNAEMMVNPVTHEINTHHDPSPVPFMLYGDSVKHLTLQEKGVLGNVAPTLLEAMGREIPREMTSGSLIVYP